MPAPAGTGLSRRTFLARAAGWRWRCSAARCCRGAYEAGVARAAAGRPRRSSSRLPRRRPRRLTLLAPVGHARYARCARRSAGARQRRRVHRGPPAVAPERRGAARPAPGREGQCVAGHRLRRREPVALHLAPLLGGRRADASGRIGWMGRYLDRTESRQPAAGLALDSPGARAGGRERAGRRGLQARATSRTTRPVLDIAAVTSDHRARGLGRAPTTDRTTSAGARRRSDHGLSALAACRAPVAGPDDGRVPAPAPSPAASPWSRRCSPGACRCAASRRRRPGATTPTPARTATCRDLGRLDSLAAFQRDLEARGLADRVLVHVWSEFGRRPGENGSRHRPRRRRRRVPHRHAGEGAMVGEFPGWRRSTSTTTSRTRATSAHLLRAAGAVAGRRRDRHRPGASGFARPALVR